MASARPSCYSRFCLKMCQSLHNEVKRCRYKYLQFMRGKLLISFMSLLYLLYFRISNLLLTLPNIRSLSSTITEELFFAGLIGNVQIDSIIPYILQMDAGHTNLLPTPPPTTSSRSPTQSSTNTSSLRYPATSSVDDDLPRKYVNGGLTKVENLINREASSYAMMRGSSAGQERFLMTTSLETVP